MSPKPDRKQLRRMQAAARFAGIRADIAAGKAAAARAGEAAAQADLDACLAAFDAPATQLQLLCAGLATRAVEPRASAVAAAAAITRTAAAAAATAKARTDVLEQRAGGIRSDIENADAADRLFDALLRGGVEDSFAPPASGASQGLRKR